MDQSALQPANIPIAEQTPEEVAQERQSRREMEREAIIIDTRRREDQLIEDTQVLFERLSAYLRGELSVTMEEYKLLERMNLITKDKYNDMTTIAHSLVLSMQALQERYAAFEPKLKEIDLIDASLTELERTLNALDAYTLRLENKFKYLKENKKLPYKKLPETYTV